MFKVHDDYVTPENKEFLKEVVQDQFALAGSQTPLLNELATNSAQWQPGLRRTGVIARKIGIYPIWLKDGTKITTTLLQVRNKLSSGRTGKQL